MNAAAGAPTATDTPLLEIRHLSKTFGETTVLSDVSLTIRAGEVRALAGANGSGKSTLIKILSGYHMPDPGGEVLLDGRVIGGAAKDADSTSRLHFIHQDLGLIGTMSAMDNLALGTGFATTRYGRISWSQQRARARAALAAFDLDLDLSAPVATLSSAEQSMVAIARAMAQWESPRSVLVLDEPTVAFTRAEAERLFVAIDRLTARGAGVLFVSHYVEELFRIATSVTVLRDGRRVLDAQMSELDHTAIVDAIVGMDSSELFDHSASSEPPVEAKSTPALSVRGLVGNVLGGVDLDVRAGEIFGIAGVDGSGREEIAGLLAGAAVPPGGEIEVAGKPVKFRSPREALRHKVALVSRDRRATAVFPHMDVREHISLPRVRTFFRGGLIRRGPERREALAWARTVDLSPCSPDVLVERLSGGNQQKVMVGRSMGLNARVLVLDEPGQGVDIGAKMIIYDLLRRAAAEGTAILICSTDVEELVIACDRVLILANGRRVQELRGAELTEDALTRAMLSEGAKAKPPHPSPTANSTSQVSIGEEAQ